MNAWKSIVIRSRYEDIRLVREDVQRELRDAGWVREATLPVLLALDESLVNAIEHGNSGDAKKQVTIRYRLERDRVVVEVADEGPGFLVGTVPPGDQLHPYADSGRGLFLIKNLMDEVAFNDRGNAIIFTKLRQAEA